MRRLETSFNLLDDSMDMSALDELVQQNTDLAVRKLADRARGGFPARGKEKLRLMPPDGRHQAMLRESQHPLPNVPPLSAEGEIHGQCAFGARPLDGPFHRPLLSIEVLLRLQ